MSGLVIITEAHIHVKGSACVDVLPAQCSFEFDARRHRRSRVQRRDFHPGRRYRAYVASKHGIQGLAAGLVNELGPENIRVNTVNPGTVNTEMALNDHLLRECFPNVANPTREDAADAFAAFTLLPIPWVEPEDVANAVLWLSSDESRYVTGIAIPVDSGMIAKF